MNVDEAPSSLFVMAGLEPAIQEWPSRLDGRVKPGHDEIK
jgi:hypothetical protein